MNETIIKNIIKNILNEMNINYKENDRKTIYPLELDFLISEYNLAIEANSLYHHSYYKGNKNRNYHNTKYENCNQKGIKLLQFYENDIVNRTDVIRSIIRNSCKISENKIFARKCSLEKIDNETLNNFCEINHLMGKTTDNSIGIALYHEHELVSVIGYYEFNGEKIITKFCSKLNYNIVGAFSKLISKLDGILRTYSSNDTSNGYLYKINGFECIKEEEYDLWYTDYIELYDRQKFMKNNIKEIFAQYDDSKTELENMIENGYDAIFRAGTKTWIRK